MEKVSIIVPVYMCQNYIQKCVESILQQDYGNFELILVLDGDYDNSGKICRKYASMDPRIQVIEKKNEGVSVARNVGIESSVGRWIVFVDSDDWLEKNYLSIMVAIAEENGADICICDYITEFATYSRRDRFFERDSCVFDCLEKQKLLASCIVNTDISDHLSMTNVGVPWAKIYSAPFIKNNNLRFVPGLKRMQDMIFNLYAFNAAAIICYKTIPLYHYLKNNQSSTVAYRPDYFNTVIEIDKEIKDFIGFSGYIELREVRYCKSVILINEIIQLQFVHADNKDSLNLKVKKIRNIISEPPFVTNIQSCKGKYLNTNQKIALFLLRKKYILLIYLYKKFKYLKETKKYFK